MWFRRAFLSTVTAIALTTASACGDSSEDGSSACPAGSESCPCYGNGTCDGALTCASNVCVALGSGGGSGTGGSSAVGVACESAPCSAGQTCCLGVEDATAWACGTASATDATDPCYMAPGTRIPPSVASCDGPEDCTAGSDCCGHGTATSFDYSCFPREGGVPCASASTTLCHSTSDCASGQTCLDDPGTPWSSCQ